MQDLIIKYLNDQCNSEETDQVLRYLRTPAGQIHLEKIFLSESNGLSNEHIPRAEPDFDQILSKIKATIDEETSTRQKVVPFYRRWYSVAAVAALLLLSTWWVFFRPASYDLYRTAYGETKVLKLYDGSTVTLNANSTLKVSTDHDAREVWLEGEAFFEVEEVLSGDDPQEGDELKKFVVHARQLDIVVVGTTFNVQNRNNRPQVVLNSGKVWLESADAEKLIMEPGEVAEVTSLGQVVKKDVADPTAYSAWKEDKLVCRNTTLEDIAEVIYHHFGYSCEFAEESIKQLAITGTLPLHEISLLTEALQESLSISIKMGDQKLIIEKKE